MVKLLKFGSIEEANHALNGGILGGAIKGYVSGLVGEEITFTSPAGSHTFTQPAGPVGLMSFADIKAQLEANIANLGVRMVDGKIAFFHETPGQAVTMAAVDEGGRHPLGLSTGTATGVFYDGPGGTPPTVEGFEVQESRIYVMVVTA